MDISYGKQLIDIREGIGMNRRQFADYLGIPYRTIKDWELDNRKMPDYLFRLIEYKVLVENQNNNDIDKKRG